MIFWNRLPCRVSSWSPSGVSRETEEGEGPRSLTVLTGDGGGRSTGSDLPEGYDGTGVWFTLASMSDVPRDGGPGSCSGGEEGEVRG